VPQASRKEDKSMSHRFDRSAKDPYLESAEEVVQNLSVGSGGDAAAASDQLYDVLSNAIVTALGDVGAAAFRQGVCDPNQMKGLARAIGRVSETVLLAYAGEVEAEPAIESIENDPRLPGLPPEPQDKLRRELEKTRQLEGLLLNAKRLPDLIDYAGSLGMIVPDETMETGRVLLGGRPTSDL